MDGIRLDLNGCEEKSSDEDETEADKYFIVKTVIFGGEATDSLITRISSDNIIEKGRRRKRVPTDFYRDVEALEALANLDDIRELNETSTQLERKGNSTSTYKIKSEDDESDYVDESDTDDSEESDSD
jgi:hypothetical protein